MLVDDLFSTSETLIEVLTTALCKETKEWFEDARAIGHQIINEEIPLIINDRKCVAAVNLSNDVLQSALCAASTVNQLVPLFDECEDEAEALAKIEKNCNLKPPAATENFLSNNRETRTLPGVSSILATSRSVLKPPAEVLTRNIAHNANNSTKTAAKNNNVSTDSARIQSTGLKPIDYSDQRLQARSPTPSKTNVGAQSNVVPATESDKVKPAVPSDELHCASQHLTRSASRKHPGLLFIACLCMIALSGVERTSQNIFLPSQPAEIFPLNEKANCSIFVADVTVETLSTDLRQLHKPVLNLTASEFQVVNGELDRSIQIQRELLRNELSHKKKPPTQHAAFEITGSARKVRISSDERVRLSQDEISRRLPKLRRSSKLSQTSSSAKVPSKIISDKMIVKQHPHKLLTNTATAPPMLSVNFSSADKLLSAEEIVPDQAKEVVHAVNVNEFKITEPAKPVDEMSNVADDEESDSKSPWPPVRATVSRRLATLNEDQNCSRPHNTNGTPLADVRSGDVINLPRSKSAPTLAFFLQLTQSAEAIAQVKTADATTANKNPEIAYFVSQSIARTRTREVPTSAPTSPTTPSINLRVWPTEPGGDGPSTSRAGGWKSSSL